MRIVVAIGIALVLGGCSPSPREPPPLDPLVKQQVLTRLCRMPGDFWRRRDVSMIELMHESGYPRVHEQITEADIEAHLRAHPDLIEDWVVESENNRGTPAWCITDSASSTNEHKQWFVSYLTRDARETEVHLFPNRYAASAFFIKRYVDQILPY